MKTKKKIRGALGEGFYGITYNSRSATLYSKFNADRIQSIRLCCLRGEHVLTDRGSIDSFLAYLKGGSEFAVKTYKTTYYLTGTESKENFEIEMAENRKLLSIYGLQAKKYLTVYPIQGFRGLSIIGSIITLRDNPPFYMIFGHRCNNNYTIEPRKMLIDLLKSLVILQKHRYLHNDIKLENIVECCQQYKFIDWGQAGPYNNLHIGDMIGTSPIKWYLMGFPDLFSTNMMALRTQMVNSDFKYSDIFTEVHQQIFMEYNEIITSQPSNKNLRKTYTATFDVFMVGMLLLRAIHRFQLDIDTWLPIVKRLVSLTNPLNAAKALAVVSRMR